MTTIINLHGGPGTGKSTSAAFLFYVLKSQDKNAELVREYVKDWAWEKRHINTYDQLYVLGKQIRRESMLYKKVDWIVTDSPVFTGTYYAQEYCPTSVAESVKATALAFYRQSDDDGHRHVHVFLKRTKKYNAEGRYQSEAEAVAIDDKLKRLLSDLKFPIVECDTNEQALRDLLISLQEGESRG